MEYAHNVEKTFNLVTRESALLCLLLLRGPQTLGELRSRAERMYAFSDLDEVGETIQSLEEMKLIRQLPRQPGQKEARFAHLLAGEPENADTGGDVLPEPASPQGPARHERIAVLEDEISDLRREMEEMKQAFSDFKQQFE